MATTKTQSNTQIAVKKPPLYHVVMLNDDYTPMEFVVEVLMEYFGHNRDTAESLMMRVHTQNRAVCGTYSRDIAETKVYLVTQRARNEEHPLRCVIEVAT